MTESPFLPHRAEHIGSLLRPTELKDAFRRSQSGQLDAAGYEAALASAIAGAVRLQEAVGLHSITDGELGRMGIGTDYRLLQIHRRYTVFVGCLSRNLGAVAPHAKARRLIMWP